MNPDPNVTPRRTAPITGSVDTVDPILAAIAAHKAANASFVAAVDRYEALECERCSRDHPRFEKAKQDLDAAVVAEVEAAWALVNVRPASRDGTLELLEYTAATGNWPHGEWHMGLLANLAAAINRFFGRRTW